MHRTTALVLSIAATLILASCGREEPKPDSTTAPSAGASSSTEGSVAASPARPPTVVTTPVRDTAVNTIASIRLMARTAQSGDFINGWMEPSQTGATRFVGPLLIYYAARADLRDAARERFGEEGADAVLQSATFFEVDIGNGLIEMFDAHHFEEARRVGPTAYVMANMADGQPMGAAIVLRENQDEWYLMLAEGEVPWEDKDIARLAGMMSGALQSAPPIARKLSEVAARVRAGEIKSIDELVAAISAAGDAAVG